MQSEGLSQRGGEKEGTSSATFCLSAFLLGAALGASSSSSSLSSYTARHHAQQTEILQCFRTRSAHKGGGGGGANVILGYGRRRPSSGTLTRGGGGRDSGFYPGGEISTVSLTRAGREGRGREPEVLGPPPHRRSPPHQSPPWRQPVSKHPTLRTAECLKHKIKVPKA